MVKVGSLPITTATWRRWAPVGDSGRAGDAFAVVGAAMSRQSGGVGVGIGPPGILRAPLLSSLHVSMSMSRCGCDSGWISGYAPVNLRCSPSTWRLWRVTLANKSRMRR